MKPGLSSRPQDARLPGTFASLAYHGFEPAVEADNCNSEALRAVVANNAGTPHASSESQEILVSDYFNKDMTVQEAFKTHAGARRVFAKFHLGGCSNCAISESETIEQVSEGYGIPLPMLMEELDKLFATGGLNVGDKVRLPDEIRSKIPQLATVPEVGEVKSVENGAYTVEFGEVRLQGLGDDFIKVETAGATA